MILHGPIKPDTLLSTHHVAGMLLVDPVTIIAWTKKGYLDVAFTPGGHRRIRASEVLDLVRSRRLPVPDALRHLDRRSVVFVDDDPREHRLLARSMKPFSDRVELTCVGDGVTALLMIGELKPALVILDVIMPGLDGVGVCERIRARPSLKDTKILIVSAHLTPEIETQALAAGADRCRAKPIDAKTILELVGLPELVPQAELSAPPA